MNSLSSCQSNVFYKKSKNFSSFVPSAFGVAGISSTSYKIYTFTSTTTTYTVPYNCAISTSMYILAVGGGGGGGVDNAGGGGGGGVVLATKIIPVGSDTITITIGSGQAVNIVGGTGNTTNVSFTKNIGLNVIAGGGGGGTGYTAVTKQTNGSSNGGSGSGTSMSTKQAGGLANNTNSNLAKNGGAGAGANTNNSGGGGAGTVGISGSTAVGGFYGNGGDGVLCTLNGIKDFGSYGTYFWGGGGGGAAYTRVGGRGGKGGGGGGNFYSLQGSTAGLGDTNCLNFAKNGTDYIVPTNNGTGGVNTGGGGGGASNGGGGSSGGAGGSGIVIIAFLP